MQDIFYTDNGRVGERRRVASSCMVDGYTNVAGGGEYRRTNGERMRFKVLHKIYDFRKRFGYDMCVGCGRCDDVCPEYISFANIINKVNAASEKEAAEEAAAASAASDGAVKEGGARNG
jgi:anaerobic sulfite reductase subunit A